MLFRTDPLLCSEDTLAILHHWCHKGRRSVGLLKGRGFDRTSIDRIRFSVILSETGGSGECLMSIDRRIQAKRCEIRRIAAQHGARNVRVFGSAARGEPGPDSDVDFLVTVQPEHSPWFPAGLIVDLEELLGCEVDVVTEEALHWFIHDRVLKEAVPL